MNTLLKVAARPHAFDLDVKQAALVVIDVQNDFCHPEGFCGADLGWDVTPLRTIIEPLQGMVEWARGQGIPVFWSKEAHKEDLSDVSPSKAVRYANAGSPVGAMGQRGRYLVDGEFGSQVIEELSPRSDEHQFAKPAQSIFPDTDFESRLEEQGITHLLIAGVTTECCVLATYRQASDLGYFALLLEDCCAAFEPRDHQAAIDVLTAEDGVLGWVATSTQVINASSEK